MGNDLGIGPESHHIEETARPDRVHNEEHPQQHFSKRHDEAQHHDKRHAKENERAIIKAAEASNQLLEKNGKPYRFRVYVEQGEMIIDLVMLDQSGAVVKEIKRNITDDDFERLIENISSIEGLLIDSTG